MNASESGDHTPEVAASPVPMHSDAVAHTGPDPASHPDPITGEAGAHPVGVGVGALGAGAAGAMIGAFAGPIGLAIGAVVGAVMGGLAGKEVAQTADGEDTPAAEPASALGDIYPAAEPATDAAGEVPGIDALKTSYATDDAGPVEAVSSPHPASVDAVPYSAPALPGDEFSAHRTPLTPEDTQVRIADVPNDVPDAASSRETKDHDVLMGAAAGSGAFEAVPATTLPPAQSYLRDEPADDVIRTTAYYKYLDRENTGRNGDEVTDWVEAEQEVL